MICARGKNGLTRRRALLGIGKRGSGARGQHRATRPFSQRACLLDVSPKRFIFLTLCAAAAAMVSLPATAAGPPLPVLIVPNAAQERLQAQIAIEQAQAQARLAAAQANVQAQLNANQARLEGQLAAQQAGTQAQLDAARQSIAMAAPMAELPPRMIGPMQQPSLGQVGTMELTTLTPRLGSYFGTDHGVLVVRAPTHGVLKLQDGDVILSIGGRIPANSSQAMRILTSYDPGETITLLVMRQHHRIKMTATMAVSPAGP